MRADARDWQGARRLFIRVADGARAPSLKALARPDDRALDPVGVRVAWGASASAGTGGDHGEDAEDLDGRVAPDSRTWLAAVRQVPPGARLWGWSAGAPAFEAVALPPARAPADVLGAALGAAPPDPIVALGGGLDSALVLGLARAAGWRPLPEAITFRSDDLPGYDESEAAARVAAAFGVRLHVVAVTAAALSDALPAAIDAVEQPLYNLHPVTRLLLARAAARLGARTLITGDGADQACAGAPAPDYTPLVAALAAAGGVALWSPFFDPAVIASCAGDTGKARLRALARALDVPEWAAAAPKVPRLAPPVDLSRHADRAAVARLAAELRAPVRMSSDREVVGWVTLALAHRRLFAASGAPPVTGEGVRCAG